MDSPDGMGPTVQLPKLLCLLVVSVPGSPIGVVLQEPFLFSGSIRENIGFGDANLSLDLTMEAARLAAIHEELVQTPMQYETRIGPSRS